MLDPRGRRATADLGWLAVCVAAVFGIRSYQNRDVAVCGFTMSSVTWKTTVWNLTPHRRLRCG
jgi:hypothetical protein